MLADVLGEERLRVRGSTVAEAIEAAYARIPALRHHLCDESGGFRTHVLCVHNGASTRAAGGLQRRVKEGDEIQILQAISGG
jgi:molybdopterin converting factor small subunit